MAKKKGGGRADDADEDESVEATSQTTSQAPKKGQKGGKKGKKGKAGDDDDFLLDPEEPAQAALETSSATAVSETSTKSLPDKKGKKKNKNADGFDDDFKEIDAANGNENKVDGKRLLVGEILSTKKVPKTDNLQVCLVEFGGDEPVEVVCGGHNARAGLKVIFAPVGSFIPSNGRSIQKVTLKGIDSFGMICSAAEMGWVEEADEVFELPDEFEPGQYAPTEDPYAKKGEEASAKGKKKKGDKSSALEAESDHGSISRNESAAGNDEPEDLVFGGKKKNKKGKKGGRAADDYDDDFKVEEPAKSQEVDEKEAAGGDEPEELVFGGKKKSKKGKKGGRAVDDYDDDFKTVEEPATSDRADESHETEGTAERRPKKGQKGKVVMTQDLEALMAEADEGSGFKAADEAEEEEDDAAAEAEAEAPEEEEEEEPIFSGKKKGKKPKKKMKDEDFEVMLADAAGSSELGHVAAADAPSAGTLVEADEDDEPLQFAGKKKAKKGKKAKEPAQDDFAVLLEEEEGPEHSQPEAAAEEAAVSAASENAPSASEGARESAREGASGGKKGKKGKKGGAGAAKASQDEDIDALLAELEGPKPPAGNGPAAAGENGEAPAAAGASLGESKSSKKKAKKGKKGERSAQEEEDLDAILAELDGPSVAALAADVSADVAALPEAAEAAAGEGLAEGDEDEGGAAGGAESAAAKRKKKKKEKEKEKKAAAAAGGNDKAAAAAVAAAEEEEERAKKAPEVGGKKGGSKLPKHVREMQEQLARMKEAEARARAEAEERRRREEEEERRLEELERAKEEAKRRRKEKEKEKLAELKRQGKLLTGKQKEEARRLKAMREQLLAGGGALQSQASSGEQEDEAAAEEAAAAAAAPKRAKVVYVNKKKKRGPGGAAGGGGGQQGSEESTLTTEGLEAAAAEEMEVAKPEEEEQQESHGAPVPAAAAMEGVEGPAGQVAAAGEGEKEAEVEAEAEAEEEEEDGWDNWDADDVKLPALVKPRNAFDEEEEDEAEKKKKKAAAASSTVAASKEGKEGKTTSARAAPLPSKKSGKQPSSAALSKSKSAEKEDKVAAGGGAKPGGKPGPLAAASAAAAAPGKPAPPGAARAAAAGAPPKRREEEESEDEEESDEEDEEGSESGSEESSEGESGDESEEEDSEEESDSEEEREDQETRRLREARLRREAKRAAALASRSADDLRSPICCILGHVDTGKTKLLDCIRGTDVQGGEAGGITQQIGATYFPMTNIKERTAELKAEATLKVPGLLIIDTPGHESFTNLRSRGSGLCDIAILVVDIMHGLEPQTLESVNLLKMRKTPFIVALNKVDRLYNWKASPNVPIRTAFERQTPDVISEFNMRLTQIKNELQEQGLNSGLYYDLKGINDFRKIVSIVPTSAISGEGVPDILMLLVQLTQKLMTDKLMYVAEVQCTVLEVKVVEGFGTTIDVVLVNGILKEGDQIVVGGLQGPIVTNIRSLLTPHPMRELRVKGSYVHHKELKAAQGIKISGQNLEHAIAGTQLYVVDPDDDVDALKADVMHDVRSVLGRVDRSGIGVCVQASTLGSLEALLEFLKSPAVKIPVSGIAIGPVHKKDVIRASVMQERKKPEFSVILAFDVKVSAEAQQMAEELGVRIFTADIIYHLFDQFTAYMKTIKDEKRQLSAEAAVFPVVLKIMPDCIFNKKDPIVLGVQVIEGIARGFIDIGRIFSMEKDHKVTDKARKGDSVAMKIVGSNAEELQKLYGRHFDHSDELVSHITRESIDTLKENFRDDLAKDEWILLVKLKKLFNIQ
eukprot:jgi/Mesen1/8932/ME000548S08440